VRAPAGNEAISPAASSSTGPSSISILAAPSRTRSVSLPGRVHLTGSVTSVKRDKPDWLDWGGQLKSVTFGAKGELDLWVALPDEYLDRRAGPFHILKPEFEYSFAKELQHARSRRSGQYVALPDGAIRFETDWRGVPTKASGLSCYALCLPSGGVPDLIEFTDPRLAGRTYGYRAMYDDQMDRVICYLDCRSSYGSFDFHLLVEFHRDSTGYKDFRPVSQGDDKHHDVGDLEYYAAWQPREARYGTMTL